jgi:hypothetical protein
MHETYQVGDKNQFLLGAVHETLLQAWHHLKELLEDPMLSSISETVVSSDTLFLREMTHSAENVSSGRSASSTSRRMPLVRRALTLHKAWTVRPK